MSSTNRRFRRRLRSEALKRIEKLAKETLKLEGGEEMTLDQLLMRLGQKDAIIFEYEVAMARAQQEIASLKEQVAGLEKAVEALQVKDVPEEDKENDESVTVPEPAEGEEGKASSG